MNSKNKNYEHVFKGLFRNFGLDLLDHFMEQLNILIHEKAKEKQEGCHRVAAEIVAGMIRGSKYWTLEMVCIKKSKLMSKTKPIQFILA